MPGPAFCSNGLPGTRQWSVPDDEPDPGIGDPGDTARSASSGKAFVKQGDGTWLEAYGTPSRPS